jgi:hypothetical protein
MEKGRFAVGPKANGHSLDGRGLSRGIAAALALAAAGILASLAMSAIALVNSRGGTAPSRAEPSTSSAATASTARVLPVKIMGSWKPGPDGKKHDAWTQTEFAVKVGKPLTLRIDNADGTPHSITSSEAGVSIIALPGVHDYQLLVTKRGRFFWRCFITCDTEAGGWAMTHPGYMSGYITAT